MHGVQARRYWDMGEDDREFKWNNYISRYHTRHLDLMDLLAMYQPRASAPLDEMAQLLGFPGKLGMDGAQVWESYPARRDRRDPQLLRDRRRQHLSGVPALPACCAARSRARPTSRRSSWCTTPWRARPLPTGSSSSRPGAGRPDASAEPRRGPTEQHDHGARRIPRSGRARRCARRRQGNLHRRRAARGERWRSRPGVASRASIWPTPCASCSASSMRVAPRCPHFDRCGGCSLQHLDARAQVAIKQRVLEDNLARIGQVQPEAMLPADPRARLALPASRALVGADGGAARAGCWWAFASAARTTSWRWIRARCCPRASPR